MRRPRNIHPAGIMTAPDMFRSGAKQLFDRKTGDYIATISTWEPEPKQHDEPLLQPVEAPKNKQQLELF